MNARKKIAKMAMLAKFIYNFNVIPIRILADIFVEIDKLILKFIQIRRDQK
jgi:hypothetical protein